MPLRAPRRGLRLSAWWPSALLSERLVDQDAEREPVLADRLGRPLCLARCAEGDDPLVLLDRAAAGERSEPRPFEAADLRQQPLERAGDLAVRRGLDEDAVEAVVRGDCAVDVGGAERVREVAVGGPHRLEVGPGEAQDAERRRQHLQGGIDGEGVARVARAEEAARPA